MDRNMDAAGLNGFPDKENVGGVVFHDQNMRITRRYLWTQGW
jgi:hypothetical protein